MATMLEVYNGYKDFNADNVLVYITTVKSIVTGDHWVLSTAARLPCGNMVPSWNVGSKGLVEGEKLETSPAARKRVCYHVSSMYILDTSGPNVGLSRLKVNAVGFGMCTWKFHDIWQT